MTDVRVRPLQDYILVEYDKSEDEEQVLDSGVITPGKMYSDVNQWGTVLAAGPGTVSKKGVRKPVQVKPGDRVLYVRFLKDTHTGKSLRFQSCVGEDQFLIREGDILAIESKEESAPQL